MGFLKLTQLGPTAGNLEMRLIAVVCMLWVIPCGHVDAVHQDKTNSR